MAVAVEIEIELPVSESRALTELVVRTCTKTLELLRVLEPRTES